MFEKHIKAIVNTMNIALEVESNDIKRINQMGKIMWLTHTKENIGKFVKFENFR